VPGNPKECREHAKRCMELAAGTTNPALKESLLDLAKTWSRLATDLDATKQLVEAWDEPKPKKPSG
jgi:hypothetical protein